jgi:hypothetical protein
MTWSGCARRSKLIAGVKSSFLARAMLNGLAVVLVLPLLTVASSAGVASAARVGEATLTGMAPARPARSPGTLRRTDYTGAMSEAQIYQQ